MIVVLEVLHLNMTSRKVMNLIIVYYSNLRKIKKLQNHYQRGKCRIPHLVLLSRANEFPICTFFLDMYLIFEEIHFYTSMSSLLLLLTTVYYHQESNQSIEQKNEMFIFQSHNLKNYLLEFDR